MRCGIGPQPSLIRDPKAAVFPRRQYGPGVQQYDMWVMDHPEGEGQGVARGKGQLPGRTLKVWHVQETHPAGIDQFSFFIKEFRVNFSDRRPTVPDRFH